MIVELWVDLLSVLRCYLIIVLLYLLYWLIVMGRLSPILNTSAKIIDLLNFLVIYCGDSVSRFQINGWMLDYFFLM